jgi:predicted permease
MRDFTRELRHAGRRLLRSPAFTVAAVLTLALGMAANSTIFTVLNRVILRPLPYPESERLLWVDHVAPGLDLPGSLGVSQGLYRYYRERVRTFEQLALFRRDEWTLTGEGSPQRLIGLVTTASLGEALRTPPIMGRWFTEEEAQDRAPVVVLTHALWSTAFGSDPGIIGRSVLLDGASRQVIGVLPRDFAFPDPAIRLYAPERLDEQQSQRVGGFNYQSVARLAPGATVEGLKREMDALIAGLKEAFRDDPVAQQALDAARLAGMPQPLKERITGSVQRTLWILLGMVGLVLLIACANVANLFLVRSEARQREVAVRRALGAGRGGILRFFLAESVLLSAMGGALGLALAVVGVTLLVRFGPTNLPRLYEVAVDPGTVAWTALLALLASGAFAVIPMLRGRVALASTLREGGRGSTVGRARFRARNALMAGQVALALVLLVASGLMVRSYLHLRGVNPGFAAANILTFHVALTQTEYATRAAALEFHEPLLERLRALPGVQSASSVSCLPLAGGCWGGACSSSKKPPFSPARAKRKFVSPRTRISRGKARASVASSAWSRRRWSRSRCRSAWYWEARLPMRSTKASPTSSSATCGTS